MPTIIWFRNAGRVEWGVLDFRNSIHTHRGYHLLCSFLLRLPSPELCPLLRKYYLNEGKKLPVLFYCLRHLARLSWAQLCSRRAITGRWSKMCEVWIVKVILVPYGGSLKPKEKTLDCLNDINFINTHELLLSSLPKSPHVKEFFSWIKYHHIFSRPAC